MKVAEARIILLKTAIVTDGSWKIVERGMDEGCLV